MRDLNYKITELCRTHREGSHGTQAARSRDLNLMADQLRELGFKRVYRLEQLKEKHVYRLIDHWKATGITDGTMKNRMSHVRWLAEKAELPIARRDNGAYGIANRVYATNADRSVEFKPEQIAALPDPHVRMSAELQREFGLRREEAMKIIPTWADKGDYIRLKDSWTKGGRPREIPVLTEAQRDALDRAKRLAPGLKDSLIPAEKSYRQHLSVFEHQMQGVGLGKSHGARHAYAQARYETLTGWKSPVAGGPTSRQLSAEQKQRDHEVRLVISEELGHSREQITVRYLGR